jgi:putative tryptophan/tyrosine transport system substrate-binding protein
MKAKILVYALPALILATIHVAEAQQPGKIPRIGLLLTSSQSFNAPRINAFRQGLHSLGYTEGKNIVIEYRYAEGKLDRLPDLATELVRLGVDVIVTGTVAGVLAAKNASSTIPIVSMTADPVASGLVESLARPGGNVTGLTNLAPDLSGKRLELLKEAVPGMTRVAFLWNRISPAASLSFKTTQETANVLGLQLQSLEVQNSENFDSAFQTMIKKRAQGFLTTPGPIISSHQAGILQFAANNRLPAIYTYSEFVDAGGLMSYNPSYDDLYRRAAIYVDKILKGAKPSDLPVEQPMKFEFVINLKTAKQIGLTIPPNVLARADKVIK